MRGFGPDAVSAVRPTRFNCLISFATVFSCIYCCISLFITFLYLDLYVLGDDAWISKGSFMRIQTYMCLDPHQN